MTQKKRIIVTGGSGKAGKWIVKDLLDNGYEVLNLDFKRPEEELCPTMIVDLTDLGQVHNALSHFGHYRRLPIAGVIHFAAIPYPFGTPNDVTFRNNVMSTYNILEACANFGINKVVLASSESSYGLCFADEVFTPKYFPVDEAHPQLPEDSYGLSKVLNELTAESFHRRTGMQIISFRLGNILEESDYPNLKEIFENQPEVRLRNLWSYIDVRDMAHACRLAVEKDGLGAQHVILSADDTTAALPSRELIQTFFPEAANEIRTPMEGREALLSNAKLKRLLDWEQKYYWRDFV